MPKTIFVRFSKRMPICLSIRQGLWILLSFTLFLPADAQISSPDMDKSFKANYSSGNNTDSVFIFNQPEYNVGKTVTLVATSTDSTTGWNFIWSVYDNASHSYVIIPMAESGVSSDIDSISVSSGYQVIMTKGILSDTFRVWVLFNDFDVIVTNKNDDGEVLSGYRSCESVSLRADTNLIPLWYPEPGTDNSINVMNKYRFTWESDNDLSDDPKGSVTGRIENPPFRDTWYIITVKDDFGLSRSDSVFCPAIRSKAFMTAEHVPLSDSAEYPGKLYKYYYDDVNSAPGRFRFDLSETENASWYKLSFGDDQTFEIVSDTDKIVHEYKLPGKYTAVLLTRSPEPYACLDSFTVENSLELLSAEFKLPNVFTPNGDLNNDVVKLYEENNVFRSEDVSTFTIEITIYDRIGKKVHEYSGDVREWKGWDGFVMGSNREAPDGVYFYCLTRHFYGPSEDNPELISREEKDKGFIHLFRD
ncbi:MAG: gliding motility-associated C-terminal domain-containing protein [Bacteroidales bacterium]|nr:gliding motility-associated C-terminal domain-containing protein [Bacteroidales bacterium]